MNCGQIEQRLSDYLEDLLAPSEATAVTAHMNDCPVCRRRRDALRAAGADLSEAVGLPLAPDVDLRAIDRWLAEQDTRRVDAWMARFSRLAPGVALAALILVIALGLARGRWNDRPARVQPVAVVQAPSPTRAAGLTESSSPTAKAERKTDSAAGHSGSPDLPERDAPSFARSFSPPVLEQVSRPSGRVAAAASAPRVDDLELLNDASPRDVHQWAPLRGAEWQQIEARVRQRVKGKDDFVQIPFPRLVSASTRQVAAAAEVYQREAAIVDPRLAREVTCAFKAAALSDLCEKLKADTGIDLRAGNSVGDEKVTLFCEKLPLREVMRQLSRPFGYAWLRTRSVLGVRSSVLGKEGDPNTQHPTPNTAYRYELAQDLRSQLLEEELRNRDRNAALIALDREMGRYRPYLNLSPDEALAKSETAPPEQKKLLEHLATDGWGLIQMWFRLSPSDLAALRAGQTLIYSQPGNAFPEEGPLRPLPEDLAHGILQSERGRRIFLRDGRYQLGDPKENPEGLVPAAVPEARAMLTIQMPQSELGQFTLTGGPGVFISADSPISGDFSMFGRAGNLAVGISPTVQNPDNGTANARLARDPVLQSRVTVMPGVWRLAPDAGPTQKRRGEEVVADPSPSSPSRLAPRASKITSADVLEALHRASGLPIVADFYTRLYSPGAVSVQAKSLFEALNRLSDTMHLRWSKDGRWLQFRSAGYFNDRLKEVPNRLLARWSASRRQHGVATLDDLIEISQLSDAQLDAESMAEGAELCYGLAEWKLPRVKWLREELRYLAEFTPEQRLEAQRPAGLAFTRMTLKQQQLYLTHQQVSGGHEATLEELARCTLRVEYTVPGEYQWIPPGWRSYLGSRVRERTQIAALQAARRIDPAVTEAQIVPTRLDLLFCYALAGENPPWAQVMSTDTRAAIASP